MVPNWPLEWGGKDWTPLQKAIWNTEMQAAYVPPPLAFNAHSEPVEFVLPGDDYGSSWRVVVDSSNPLFKVV